MMASLKPQWKQVQAEWQANKRLQLISIVALVLFILWTHTQLDNWRAAKKNEAIAAYARYQDTLAVAKEDAWINRAKEAGLHLQQMQTKLWVATSEGEAEAKLRDWLQQQARTFDLPITRISVEVGVASRGERYRPVHVDIQGVYKAGAWQQMLQSINASTPPVIVDFEQLNIANSQNLFYRLNLTAWFVINNPSEVK
jgi:hypothetical protein